MAYSGEGAEAGPSCTSGTNGVNGATANGSVSANGRGPVRAENSHGLNGGEEWDGTHGASAGNEGAGGSFMPLYEGSAIDKREFVRLTLQSLRDLGFESSARSLEAESGMTLEHPSITAFRTAVLTGDWRNAERLLVDGLTYGASRRVVGATNGASSSSGTSTDRVLRRPDTRSLQSIKFLIHQQRYLELLEVRQTKKALSVLRDHLAPLNHGSDRLHLLSSLVMCANSEELRARANWDGANGQSRRKLLHEIEASVSPTVMVPSRRLPQLLEQAQTLQKQRDAFYNLPMDAPISLYVDYQSDRSVFPNDTAMVLKGHEDEVWHLAFSHDGTRLVTAGKDKYAIVWKVGADFSIAHKFGPHSDAISCVAWSPDDRTVLTTAESEVTLWKVETAECKVLTEHQDTVGTAAWLPDGKGFVTGGMDCRIVFWDAEGNVQHVWNTSPFRVMALAVTPNGQQLVAVSVRATSNGVASGSGHQSLHAQGPPSSATGSSSQVSYSESPSPISTIGHGLEHDNRHLDLAGGSRVMGDRRQRIHFYDIEKRTEVGTIYMNEEMSSVTITQDSRYALINQRPNEIHLWDIEQQCVIQKYIGHRQDEHVIRSCFGGAVKSFVISGSEDALVYVWHRHSGKLLETLYGHGEGSVNSVAWHPTDPAMFASCSDDHTIRIWRPGPGSSNGLSAEIDKEHYAGSDGVGISPFPWASSPPHRDLNAGAGATGPTDDGDEDAMNETD